MNQREAHHDYGRKAPHGSGAQGGHQTDRVTDPVCGMSVDPNAGKPRIGYEGETYHFCSQRCADRFAADPEQFLSAKCAEEPAMPGSTYTCPMHPEIVQDGPGSCPICGMALEPMDVSASGAPNPELADFTHRLWVAGPLALLIVLIEMPAHVGFDLFPFVGPVAKQWVQFALATPVVLWAGAPFFQRGWASVRTGHLNMFTLIAMGAGAAFAFSAFAIIAPGFYPEAARDHHGLVPVYFEAAAVIVALVLLGQVLELRARDRTGDALRALLDLSPETALRLGEGGATQEIALSEVRPGDVLRVKPGGKVPIDGIVVAGRSAVDESLLTGEPDPVMKQDGDTVTGGTLNTTGSFDMRVERTGSGTTLARIVALVSHAQRSRAPIQSLADRVSGYFVPAVILVAAIAFFAWLMLGSAPALAYAIVAAVSVLIIACPCALGLATPISIMVATGRGAREGLLIRDAEALERLAAATVLVVDKTGTLTEGKPRVVGVKTFGGMSEDELLRLAASLEASSEHPLAASIVGEADRRKLGRLSVQAFDSITGRGVHGKVDGRDVVLGNQALAVRSGFHAEDSAHSADLWRSEGATVLFMTVDGKAAGLIAVADPIRDSAQHALRALEADGIEIVMATGDDAATARAVAARLGIARIEAGVTPEEKLRLVESLKTGGRIVAMAGDGINDAPALAGSDVGIAMEAGADAAIESAGVTLMGGDLRGVVRARRLARATMRNIRQNLGFAFIYNALGVPVAAGVLYPVFGILLSPILAAAAMSLSSVSVIANALRLKSVSLN